MGSRAAIPLRDYLGVSNMFDINGCNVIGAGSTITGDASLSRTVGSVTVTLAPQELAKRIRKARAEQRRAEAKAQDKLAAEEGIYLELVAAGLNAVQKSESERHAWRALACVVMAVYGENGAAKFEDTRDQFIADCIIPGLDDKVKIDGLDYSRRALMLLDLPRAGTNDAKSFPKFEATRKAKSELARYVTGKLWPRVLDYAYPKVKPTKPAKAVKAVKAGTNETGETGGLTLAKFTATVSTLLKQLQASNGIDGLDMSLAVEGLNSALTAVSKK
jgi:hypothetical protein